MACPYLSSLPAVTVERTSVPGTHVQQVCALASWVGLPDKGGRVFAGIVVRPRLASFHESPLWGPLDPRLVDAPLLPSWPHP